jgi:hypothetical protein
MNKRKPATCVDLYVPAYSRLVCPSEHLSPCSSVEGANAFFLSHSIKPRFLHPVIRVSPASTTSRIDVPYSLSTFTLRPRLLGIRCSMLRSTSTSTSLPVPRTPLLPTDDPGEPLFLQSLHRIWSNRAGAKSKSHRPPTELYLAIVFRLFNGEQNWDSNLFFWFFPAQSGDTMPLLLWLQRWTGSSSLFGLFAEQGPILVDKAGNADPRNITWNSKLSFALHRSASGHGLQFHAKRRWLRAQRRRSRTKDLYAMLQQFFRLPRSTVHVILRHR